MSSTFSVEEANEKLEKLKALRLLKIKEQVPLDLRRIHLHPAQAQVAEECKRFNVIDAGRRFGKSIFGIDRCIEPALYRGLPVGWFAPSYKNLADMWREVISILGPVMRSKNEVEKRIELISGGSIEMWSMESPDSARGRHYARVILDECAMVKDLMSAWNLIIRPMLMDLRGDAYFLSTPKGRNGFMEMWELGQNPEDTEWKSWRFPTSVNPHIHPDEIEGMRKTMPVKAFEQEVMARFIDEVSGALWKLSNLDQYRVSSPPDDLLKIVVAIDPAVSSNADSDETGIIGAGLGRDDHGYILADSSGTYTPLEWGNKAIAQYDVLEANRVVAEVNNGGDLVKANLMGIRSTLPFESVHASRGKAIRAEPIAALYEQGRVHHVGFFPDLEQQMTMWSPADDRNSPDRVDAMVWALSNLMLTHLRKAARSRQG